MRLRAFSLVVLISLAQPAAATQTLSLAKARTDAAAVCNPDRPCDPATAPEAEPGSVGPLVAGVVGLLVLAGVFGRRRSRLPEVVS